MTLQETIVPGRLRSELYPWGVKQWNLKILLIWNKVWNPLIRQIYEIIVEYKHVTLTCIYAAYSMHYMYHSHISELKSELRKNATSVKYILHGN